MSTFQLTVHDFYKAYAKWLFNPDDERIFEKRLGLCDNLYGYMGYHYGEPTGLRGDGTYRYYSLRGAAYNHFEQQDTLLHQHFREAGLDTVFPFDTEGSYMRAAHNKTQHLNEKRRAFVFAHSHDNQSAMLGMFYRWLVNELDTDNIIRQRGICNYVDTWCSQEHIAYDANCAVTEELKQQFENTYANDLAPFNGNMRGFWAEQDRLALWDNPKRVEWVRAHAQLVQ
ncbi:hypothetical protein EVB62_003 [Rhizobium phage RHph_TM33]|uniref:Uncharacterized protein n=1 Tax=Rhizobium phage RHph_TM33 TaxID=2509765 RepID=A0A7S5QYW2_9CAUD|nr:hypothetical protein EVB62_003 [Rhizobium phage RHph_TM33]QIG68462.1 hypothetical protein EVB63_003 [Rhizobium phage RHph_TM38]